MEHSAADQADGGTGVMALVKDGTVENVPKFIDGNAMELLEGIAAFAEYHPSTYAALALTKDEGAAVRWAIRRIRGEA